MASLYRKSITVRDPKTGEQVKTHAKKWWGRLKDALGREKRVPLATDKRAAQAMLNDLVKRVEREAAGIADPFEEHAKQPLSRHIKAFEEQLEHKGDTKQYVYEMGTKVRNVTKGCRWSHIADLSASRLQGYLSEIRSGGLSMQTSNHYLRAIKQFSQWLVRDRRAPGDPLAHLAKMNVQVDRWHDRRALSPDEFARLVEAARTGKSVEKLSGSDRAMMYVLSAWTGYRKKEIASLTRRSFRLDGDPPTATVAAGYSKRRQSDTQVLHPELVARLRAWLATKDHLGPDDQLFPVSKLAKSGTDRRTSKMMQKDLAAAREKWIVEAKTVKERRLREKSDFLAYKDSAGRYADFHSHRHTFITSLERAGVSPRTAQTLARHSDIRLTMGTYMHIGLDVQTSAIGSLPAPPKDESSKPEGGSSEAA